MENLDFVRMQQMQKELHEKYEAKWGPLSPKIGRDILLWKKGDKAIMEEPDMRHDFIEEMTDVLMYFNDLMLCYSITPEDISRIYTEKHNRNMKRW